MRPSDSFRGGAIRRLTEYGSARSCSSRRGVDTVLPYFERFINRFADFAALAGASEEELYRVWQGLGYYSRARNLQRAAQIVTERFSGAFAR